MKYLIYKVKENKREFTAYANTPLEVSKKVELVHQMNFDAVVLNTTTQKESFYKLQKS